MIPHKYIQGLDANDWDTPGIFGVHHARNPSSWRIICSYEDGKRHKQALFTKMARAGQTEPRKTWDFHHVVEGQHFADVDFNGELAHVYTKELPCVLIAREEHHAYNSLLHVTETDELFRDRGLPADMLRRSAAAASTARTRSEHPRLRARVQSLLMLYRNAYSGDPVLVKVAENVLNDALMHLR